MVGYYPLSAFGQNRVAASIDTPLHAFLPFSHVDHLHPDWAIALASSANGKRKLDEFNREFGRRIVWIPWQRPGFELALMIEKAVKDNPGAEGLILGGHGLFTWGMTQRECYLNSIRTIDQMGEFIQAHQANKGSLFGGLEAAPLEDRKRIAAEILPTLRGAVSSNRRVIAHYTDHEDALTFAGSEWGEGAERTGHELSGSLPANSRVSRGLSTGMPPKRTSTCSKREFRRMLQVTAPHIRSITKNGRRRIHPSFAIPIRLL